MAKYLYSNDLLWKYEMIREIFKHYNEPSLNLHFLGPYLKNFTSSQSSYDLIFALLRVMPEKSRSSVFDNLKAEIDEYKKDLIERMDEDCTYQVLPLYHIMIYMILNFSYADHKEIFKDLATTSHELRLMPLPYGLLPHELIEIIDNERILPGINRIYKLGEDFPFLNYYNQYLIDQKEGNQNWQQRALMFNPAPGAAQAGRKNRKSNTQLFDLIRHYKSRTNDNDKLLDPNDWNNIRYTFVNHLFEYHKQSSESFKKKLKGLKSWYIWNIYKQLSAEILEKAADLKYSEIE